MRQINTIRAEIVELSEIKSAYNYFLASHESQVDVENATYIRNNKAIVSENLRKLYVELANSQKAKGTSQQPGATSKEKRFNNQQTLNDKLQANENTQPNNPLPDTRNLRMKFEPYHASEAEQRAILLFNSDKRYKITE